MSEARTARWLVVVFVVLALACFAELLKFAFDLRAQG